MLGDFLRGDLKFKEEKEANIVFISNKVVLVNRQKVVIYMSIADKVERILKNGAEKTRITIRYTPTGRMFCVR